MDAVEMSDLMETALKAAKRGGSHGSQVPNPHADRRNWQPADNYEDWCRNLEEGLEQWSERKFAKSARRVAHDAVAGEAHGSHAERAV